MQAAGQAKIDRAKADGRWEAAYDSPANAVGCPTISPTPCGRHRAPGVSSSRSMRGTAMRSCIA